MSSRNNILSNLQKATEDFSVERPMVPSDAEIFSDMPGVDLLDTFTERLTELSGEVYIAGEKDVIVTRLKELTDGKKVCATDSVKPLLGDIQASRFDGTAPNSELAEYDIMITSADALVARTGSVVLNSEAVGRRAAFIAPFHIVIASKDILVPSLEQAISTDAIGRSTVIISGPARTADIEKILILGAHGPKRLAVIVY